MDLSHSFRTVTQLLLRRGSEPIVTFYPSNKPIATVSCLIKDQRVSGTGVGNTQYEAFLKAISELGEAILKTEIGLKCRSGLAGGIVRSNIIVRAQSELIERDSFFFHYHRQIPFKFIGTINLAPEKTLDIYSLQSAITEFQVALVCHKNASVQGQPYLGFASGAHTDWDSAVSKAIDEYISTSTFLETKLKQMEERKNITVITGDIMNNHLMATLDPRNLKIFKKLYSENNVTDSTPKRHMHSTKSSPWKTVELNSPVRFLRFIHVSNPKLQIIQFGIPENESTVDSNPLYHPFW